jgi:hypothetical protein
MIRPCAYFGSLQPPPLSLFRIAHFRKKLAIGATEAVLLRLPCSHLKLVKGIGELIGHLQPPIVARL